MTGILSTIISAVLLILTFAFGKVVGGKFGKSKAETIEAKLEIAHNVQTAEAHKTEAVLANLAAESVATAQKAETERVLTSAEIQDKLVSAMRSGDQTIILELAGQMAQRAKERIDR